MFSAIASAVANKMEAFVFNSLAAVGLDMQSQLSDPSPAVNTEIKWATYVFWPGMPPKVGQMVSLWASYGGN
jgi:hypothetical protein